MPWCPSCSTEINLRKRKCPECGQNVCNGPGFTTPISFMDREWYTIRSINDPDQAENLRDWLESKGYDVAIRNGSNGCGNGKPKMNLVNQNGSSMQILVHAEKAPGAAALVRTNAWLEHSGNGLGDIEHFGLFDDDVEYEEDHYSDDRAVYDTGSSYESYDDFDDFN